MAGPRSNVSVHRHTRQPDYAFAYGSVEARLALIEATHRAFIKPIPVHQVVPGGFTYDDFAADLHAGTAAGHTRRIPASRRVNFAVNCRRAAHYGDSAQAARKGAGSPCTSVTTCFAQRDDKPRPSSSSRPTGDTARCRTRHRLAHPRQPTGPLPRRDQQQPLAATPHGCPQPAPTCQPGARPPARRLGYHLTHSARFNTRSTPAPSTGRARHHDPPDRPQTSQTSDAPPPTGRYSGQS